MTTDSRRIRRPARSVRAWALVLVQIISLVFQNACALANPTGGTPVAGAAGISQSGNTVTVTQTTNRAVINWQDFSINQGEVTNFVLPGSNAAVLNRVVGNNTSVLLGTLQSNGSAGFFPLK